VMQPARMVTGASRSASPAIRVNAWRGVVCRRMSVQLEDQPVEVRADAQNHLADDVDVVAVLRVDRAVPDRPRREEYASVRGRDVEPEREATWRQGLRARERNVRAHRDLALPLRPNDRIHLSLDDSARIRLERDLSLVAGLHLAKLVLPEHREHLVVVLDER